MAIALVEAVWQKAVAKKMPVNQEDDLAFNEGGDACFSLPEKLLRSLLFQLLFALFLGS